MRVDGNGDKIAPVPLPPAVGRAIDRAIEGRECGPIPRSRTGHRTDRRPATRRLRVLAASTGVVIARMHPHMMRNSFVTTMLDAGVDLRDVQIAPRHADPRTTMRYDRHAKPSAGTPTTSLSPTCLRHPVIHCGAEVSEERIPSEDSRITGDSRPEVVGNGN